ncbi:MAG: class I SAM-dependent methyltransferase [Pseudomonadota bacterium]
MASNDRIFLFWGEDLRQFKPGLLDAHARAGDTLLPVNAEAMHAAQAAGLSIVLPEAWLGTEETLNARWAADDWEARWFEPSREALSSDGICWPVFDKEALNWYWRDVTLADALVRACRTRGVEKVSLVLNNPLRPALGYGRSDVPGHLMRAALGDRVAVRETAHDPWPAILSSAIDLDRLRKGTETFTPDRIAGKIVLALNPGEFHRFTPVIQELCRRFPGRVTVVALWPSPAETATLARTCPAEVLTPALAPAVDPDIGKRFFAGYLKATASAGGQPWGEALALTRFQFEYYCVFRLPVLANNYRSWSALWQAYPPAVVITSSLSDSEAQLPALAADRADVPTVSLPHGGFGAREQDCHARTVLYNCVPTRRVYEAAGIAAGRLRPCREVIAENEYPTRTGAVFSRGKAGRILVLTNPVKFDTCLFNTTLIGSQMAALKAIATPPAHLVGKVDLAVKTHPSRHDRSLFELAGEDLARRVLPSDLPLSDALERTDLVVALNYPGTALIYTLRRRRAVIFFWNDPLLLQRSHSYRHAHLMLEAGDFVKTAEGLWQAVERFFSDPAYAAMLRERADAFAREQFDTDDFPTIGQVMETLIPPDRVYPKREVLVESTGVETMPLPQAFPQAVRQPVNLAGYNVADSSMRLAELRTLCTMVQWRNPQRIFEIGTFRGATTLLLAANSNARIHTLDLPPLGHPEYTPPQVENPEHDVYPEKPGICFRSTDHARRIEQLYGNSRTFDFSPFFGQIDFVFVNGAHHFDAVLHDSMNAFRLIGEQGVIFWHDYAEYAPEVMRALQTVANRFPLVHIEGTSLAVYGAPGPEKT